MSTDFQLRAVAFPEGDVWVVQGVEYDIVAQARDLMDAPGAFLRQFLSTLIAYRHLGKDANEHLPPAPARFREMFEAAKPEAEFRFVSASLGSDGVSRADVDLRAYQQAA